MPNQTVPDIIANQDWLEPIESGLQTAVRSTWNATGETGRKVEDALHGVWLGDPLHAALTDIPIGSWTAALAMDAAESIGGNSTFGKGADAAITVGLVGAVASAITGLTDWQHVGGAPRRVGLVHGLMNLAGAGLFAASLIMRRKGSRNSGKLLSLGGYAVMLGAARLGGELVYRHHVGVDHAPEDAGPEEFTSLMPEADLLEKKPRRVDVQGIPIVLIKSGGNVFALAEKCAHLGGPLSEGDCENGVIQCPWHGSQFSIRDGQVVHGPAVHPQVCFDVRIRAGQVEVRRHLESPRKGHDRSEEAA
jgi:nitrite reductase/ring-hydroxylating ferredoxin subunit/uncharacterized membrane protein